MKVLHYPRDRNPYGDRLNEALEAEGVKTGYLEKLFPSATLDLFVLPFRSLLMRSDIDVVHIHWLFYFAPLWIRGRVTRRLMRMWLGFWLWSLRRAGVKIAWTAHNFLPHQPIFDDDRAARRLLVRYSDIVIAFDRSTARRIEDEFGGESVHVVLPAAESPTRFNRETARLSLGLTPDEHLIVLLGTIAPYKGTDQAFRVLIEWADHNPEKAQRVRVVVAGALSDPTTRIEIQQLVTDLRTKHVAVETYFDRISDEELDKYYAAADATFLLFRNITNSSSLANALAAGTPVIVNSFPSLEHFKSDATLVVSNHAEAVEALIKVLSWSEAERTAARAAALEWASTRTWRAVGQETAALYREALRS
ncbi:MAG: glycosyltransferase [Actinobacteria bacterium]|nr:glycosyltransferase [Actinomycetota bacterium]